MSIGMPTLSNVKLLDEIQSRYPSGVFSEESFLKKVKRGSIFFFVYCTEEGNSFIRGPYKVKSKRKNVVKIEEGLVDRIWETPKFWYKLKSERIDYLIHGANACFIDYNDADGYMNTLNYHMNNLYSMV